jgi:starch synthase
MEVALAGRLARRPVVLHLHDLVVPGLGRRVLGTAVSLSTRGVAISKAVRECVPARLHDKVDVVHNGVSTTRFAPGPPDPQLRANLGARSDELLVGVLGRIDPEKGHDVVIRAVGRLRGHLPVHLAVVGAPLRDANGWYDHLHALADEAAPGAVTFAAPHDDVPTLLRSLDALVSAAPAEPFGLTILEAQACGTPSVAARGGGVPEIVDDGVTGRLFAPRDAGELAHTLEDVLTDTVATARIVAAARARVIERSSLSDQADRFATVYRSAVGAEPDRVTAWN